MSRFAPLSYAVQQALGWLLGATVLMVAAGAVLACLVLFFALILALAVCERVGWVASLLSRPLGFGRTGAPEALPRR